jgi:hypothetical protein
LSRLNLSSLFSSGPFPVTNARYFVTVFPVSTIANSQWNIQTPCGAMFAAHSSFMNPNMTQGILEYNTTSTTLVVPTLPNTQYRVAVSATCLAADNCRPATVYGEYASAHPLVFTSGGGQAQTLTEYVHLCCVCGTCVVCGTHVDPLPPPVFSCTHTYPHAPSCPVSHFWRNSGMFVSPLRHGRYVTVTGSVSAGNTTYYIATVNEPLLDDLYVTVVTYLGDADLYVNIGSNRSFPNTSVSDFRAIHAQGPDTVIIPASNSKYCSSCTLYIAVVGFVSSQFSITFSSAYVAHCDLGWWYCLR